MESHMPAFARSARSALGGHHHHCKGSTALSTRRHFQQPRCLPERGAFSTPEVHVSTRSSRLSPRSRALRSAPQARKALRPHADARPAEPQNTSPLPSRTAASAATSEVSSSTAAAGAGEGAPNTGSAANSAAFSGANAAEGHALEREQNLQESMEALSALGRTVESLPPDLALAVGRGRIPGEIISRLAGMEESAVLNYLLRFGGFRERLLADDLFLTKVGIEVGVGVCTKTSAEFERRRGMFFAEFDFVIADVIMAIIADFMLVWLPAPTVALGNSSSGTPKGSLQTFLDACPDNAFQVALRGEEFSALQRCTAILRNGVKLFAVGTCSSLFGTALTNGVIVLRSTIASWGEPEAAVATVAATAAAMAAAAAAAAAASSAETVEAAASAAGDSLAGDVVTATAAEQFVDMSAAATAAAAAAAAAATAAGAAAVAADAVSAVSVAVPPSVEVPILATSLAYGAYMAISSNLRYQIVAGVLEQRILEPWLHDKKLALSVMSFVVRTSNTFLGSLLWVDFARWVGVQ